MWDNDVACCQTFEVPSFFRVVSRYSLISSIFFYGEEAPFFQSKKFPVEFAVLHVMLVFLRT
jgi:hypothetical protein